MTDVDLMLACTELMRATRNSQVLDLCVEVQRRLVAHTLPPTPSFDKRSYMRSYMRAYRIKNRANPFA